MKTAHILAAALALVLAAGASATPHASLSMKHGTLVEAKDTCSYKYTVTANASPGSKDDPTTVTIEAFFITRDWTGKKANVDAVFDRRIVCQLDLTDPSQRRKTFTFESPDLDKAEKALYSTSLKLKGVAIRAVAGGKVLATACDPAGQRAWTKAIAKIPTGVESMDSLSLDSASTMAYFSGSVERVATNIMLMTEWAYNEKRGKPQAFINGELKCKNHASTHIIAYNVSPYGVDVYDGKFGCLDVDMTIRGVDQCVFRCWEKGYKTYDKAPQYHKAEIKGDVDTLARFRVCYENSTGDWMLLVRPPPYRFDSNGNLLK